MVPNDIMPYQDRKNFHGRILILQPRELGILVKHNLAESRINNGSGEAGEYLGYTSRNLGSLVTGLVAAGFA